MRSLGPPEDLQGRARAFAAALPSDVAFSHITSARLLGLPLPSRIVDSALHVMRSSDRTRIRRTGCRGHRGLETRGVEIVKGLRVVCGPDTWCDLGDLLTGLLTVDDLIVIGDAILARLGEEPSVLASVLESRVRPRGRTMLTEALGLIRAGARSPMESLTRLMFVRAGFPEPVSTRRSWTQMVAGCSPGILCGRRSGWSPSTRAPRTHRSGSAATTPTAWPWR